MALPSAISALAVGRSVRAVWLNELGGVTFEVGTGSGRCFAKWAPATSTVDLSAEAVRLVWAGTFITVPRVVDLGADEAGSWMVTTGLPGMNAVDDRWKAEPATAVRAIGLGLRALHDALPVEACPFSWSSEDRLADIRQRASAGSLAPATWHEAHQSLSVEGALELLAFPPPVDHLVVCHGDACAPNTLITEEGRWSGHVDLGALGTGDRWADLAVATWSTEWNYGPGWEGDLLSAYGVRQDPYRMRYYRLLWDLGP